MLINCYHCRKLVSSYRKKCLHCFETLDHSENNSIWKRFSSKASLVRSKSQKTKQEQV